jgi:lysophosphatidic acid acyltransferase/lysophosphatidylinositol acyltransferase
MFVQMLLYAEGTRFTKEKHEASIKFAQTKGLPELKEHLLPRTKGFTIGLPHFRQNLPAVYNVQIVFKGYIYIFILYVITFANYYIHTN